MRKNEVELYGTKAYGVEVSEFGREHGYLDYNALYDILGACILNNTIRAEVPVEWEVINGDPEIIIHQEYIISELGATILHDLTDELVFYSDQLDLYIWAVDHYGTAWTHVLTDVKLV